MALPPEHRDHFSEKLLLMNPCYIVNDYAQVQGSVLSFHSDKVFSLLASFLFIINSSRNLMVNGLIRELLETPSTPLWICPPLRLCLLHYRTLKRYNNVIDPAKWFTCTFFVFHCLICDRKNHFSLVIMRNRSFFGRFVELIL